MESVKGTQISDTMMKPVEKEAKKREEGSGLSPERREIMLDFMAKHDKTLKALSK
jgi:hypothetical protein